MALNYIFIAFFLLSVLVALIKLIFMGDTTVFPNMMAAVFDKAKFSASYALGLAGLITFWMGIMKVGENGGAVSFLSRLVSPFFTRIFPEIPKNHKVFGSIVMNFSANILGLGNAATPLGLKAMNELQELNEKKERATNAMIMFLVLNTSGLTLIPTSVMNMRATMLAENPADVFLPILLTTSCSTIVGLLVVSLIQRINLFNLVVLGFVGGYILLMSTIVSLIQGMPPETLEVNSSIASALIIFTVIAAFILLALRKKVNVYDSFIDGAKEGFNISVKMIPYLVAILVAIGVFTASGCLDMVVDGVKATAGVFTDDTTFAEALPVGLMKPLTGGGAEGMAISIIQQPENGVDSFLGKMVSTMLGSTDTTFFVLALYFGSVGIKNSRYAVLCGLAADIAGMIAAIFFSYLFYAH